MTHLLVAAAAVGVLSAVLATVFVLQKTRPALRRVGATMLIAMIIALLIVVLRP